MAERAFLHGIDIRGGTVVTLRTTAETLRSAAFVDGRTPLSAAPPETAPLARFLERERPAAPAPRYLFHLGFCGSTLLARLLDAPGRSLVLREPNCLAQLANLRAETSGDDDARRAVDDVVPGVARHLARPWAPHEAVAVKPSNWANNLIPQLLDARGARAVFLTSSRRRFLLAVLRGGPARLAFAARATVHLSVDSNESAQLVSAALSADSDSDRQLARLATVLHEIQLQRFRAADPSAELRIDQDDLARDPAAAVARAAAILDLSLDDEAIAANLERWLGRHAKDPAADYSIERERRAEDVLEERHGPAIEHALSWAEGAIGPG